jgi:hypothetical protein
VGDKTHGLFFNKLKVMDLSLIERRRLYEEGEK